LRIGASTWADQVHVQVAVKVHDDVNDNARPPLTSAGALSGASDSWIRVYVTVFSSTYPTLRRPGTLPARR
jgi:hypothetical protein